MWCLYNNEQVVFIYNKRKNRFTKHSQYLPGATIISFFFVLILRKERSFCGSKSLTVVRDLLVSWCTKPAYCTVVALSIVVRIGMPT